MDDEIRWLIALLSDTGTRISEVVGLTTNNLFLDAETPYVIVKKNEGRRIKNDGSTREIPLVGASLWAAKRAFQHKRNGFLFPRYIDFKKTPPKAKGTHASNTANDWIRAQGIDETSHSFRHGLTDRLREVGAPSDVRDQIEGWKTAGMGAHYGKGHSLAVKAKYMSKTVLSDLFPSSDD